MGSYFASATACFDYNYRCLICSIFCRHDTIGRQLGVPIASFETQNEGPVLHMKKLLFDYIRTLQDILDGGPSRLAGVPVIAKRSALEITSEGYPKLLPDFIPGDTMKRPLEAHMRHYLSQHYCMYYIVL